MALADRLENYAKMRDHCIGLGKDWTALIREAAALLRQPSREEVLEEAALEARKACRAIRSDYSSYKNPLEARLIHSIHETAGMRAAQAIRALKERAPPIAAPQDGQPVMAPTFKPVEVLAPAAVANQLEGVPNYKVMWERDSSALGKCLQEIHTLKAVKEDQRAQIVDLESDLADMTADRDRCASLMVNAANELAAPKFPPSAAAATNANSVVISREELTAALEYWNGAQNQRAMVDALDNWELQASRWLEATDSAERKREE